MRTGVVNGIDGISPVTLKTGMSALLRVRRDLGRPRPPGPVDGRGGPQASQNEAMSASDLFSIEGKTALVTGGSRGIGKMIAEGYVEAGATVYISSRKADVCQEVADELSKKGTCVAVPADLSKEDECRRLADEMATRVDKLDILVNNAGATWGAPLAEYDEAAFERVLGLNVKGVFHVTKFMLPLLEKAGTQEEPARVINIGSIDGIQVPVMETYAYSASKAAVHQLTRHLAKRLAPSITVNAIAPGPFESKMMAATLEAFGDQIRASAPLRRIGRPDDVAGTAIYLASRAGAYVTGAIIPVDGGIATTH
jgi:NAD(P)-dependent dehydrogenase (short-subunit alcohol dehydrogenase family)